MSYDEQMWDNYAKENEKRYNEAFANFMKDLVVSLRCTSVLEVGCGTGVDLRLFPENFEVHGVDLNDLALGMAREKNPTFDFRKGSVIDLPFADSSVDFVFTHKFLNCLNDKDLEKGISEIYRVSRKYIANCEFYDKSESRVEGIFSSRNMGKRWSNYSGMIISDVDMHEDIEPEKIRFTLLKKFGKSE